MFFRQLQFYPLEILAHGPIEGNKCRRGDWSVAPTAQSGEHGYKPGLQASLHHGYGLYICVTRECR